MATDFDATQQGSPMTGRWGRSYPAFSRGDALLKGALDRLIAFLLLLILAPLLLIIVVAVRCEGRPVFILQERVGVQGSRFRTRAFRSSGVRVGPVLRRYSLVDLPQLLNVAGGSMSLVGPPPPRVDEAPVGPLPHAPVVKPGLTGLGEPGGPPHSWEDAEQLELRYAQSWTPALDARIVARCLRTALHDDQVA
jgi:lipopolysaccharide/colanic/teichoic acid biosynthesis glycosyltransferase